MGGPSPASAGAASYRSTAMYHQICHDLARGERERLFGSREWEGKLKITFPFYGKGTGIHRLLREGKCEACNPGNPGNHIKSKIKFKIIFMP